MTSVKKKSPSKKKTVAKKAPVKRAVVVAVPDYAQAASELIRGLGFSNSPHPDHVAKLAASLMAAFELGRSSGKG